MSAERLEGKAYSYSADIWALGVTLTALALGYNPVRHKTFFQLLEFLKTNPFPTVPDTYSNEFREFLARCLQRQPEDRATAGELLDHAWIRLYQRSDMPLPQAILHAYIERAAEGNRYKRDMLNDLASRVNLHLAERMETARRASPRAGEVRDRQQVVVPLSKVRRLSQQLGVPVRHTIKAFKNNA